jgi:hypothetical protein
MATEIEVAVRHALSVDSWGDSTGLGLPTELPAMVRELRDRHSVPALAFGSQSAGHQPGVPILSLAVTSRGGDAPGATAEQ